MKTPKILIHTHDPAQTAMIVARDHPDLRLETCQSNAQVPDLVARFAPEVIYTVRFDRSAFPHEAVFGPGGPKWLAVGGAGVDHLGQWDPARVTVTNAAGVAAQMMAQYVIGAFLHFSLGIPGMAEDQRAHRWNRARMVSSLAARRLLIVGLGHTGRAVARLARPFGIRVTGLRAHPRPTDDVDEVRGIDALHELLPQADLIAICLPLTDATRGLFDAGAIAAIKPGALLVDVSRGGILDHAALLPALASGQVGGAALDVFPAEPLPRDAPIWEGRNLLISPHASAYSSDWEAASARMFSENLARYRQGSLLSNIVDPARGY